MWFAGVSSRTGSAPNSHLSARLNSLFVLGRNIYQAACGSSKGAIEYLIRFITKTNGTDVACRKALLDGMLFEIFFDSRAQIREQPKNRYLEGVFDLQQYDELSDSFAFMIQYLRHRFSSLLSHTCAVAHRAASLLLSISSSF
jgi:hypothetical protein